MPIKLYYSVAMGISTYLFADGAQQMAQGPNWTAIGNFGLAIVMAFSSFSLLVWYLKTKVVDDREDAKELRKQNGELEDKHVELVKMLAEGQANAIKVIELNTATMATLNAAVETLNTRLAGRACMAVETLSPEDRTKVYDLLRRRA